VSFQPLVPFTGYAGWRFLTRTLEAQEVAHAAAPERQRDTEYFRDRIGQIRTPEELVSDRRLLKVALGAFGLDADIGNRFFIGKVLSDGYSDREALANRLADKRYLAFSQAFGFGEGLLPRTALSTFPDEILASYAARQFEIDVGVQNEDMRLALGARREIAALAAEDKGDTTKWFTIMGTPPLRRVFETALGLPRAFGSIDIDKQLGILREASARTFGTSEVADFAAPEVQEKLVRLFLVRSEIASGAASLSSGRTALLLLSRIGA
jgi:hypothetical protein